MVKVRSVQEVLLVFRTVFQVAEIYIPQRKIGVAVSTKPRLHVKQELSSGLKICHSGGTLPSCVPYTKSIGQR